MSYMEPGRLFANVSLSNYRLTRKLPGAGNQREINPENGISFPASFRRAIVSLPAG